MGEEPAAAVLLLWRATVSAYFSHTSMGREAEERKLLRGKKRSEIDSFAPAWNSFWASGNLIPTDIFNGLRFFINGSKIAARATTEAQFFVHTCTSARDLGAFRGGTLTQFLLSDL